MATLDHDPLSGFLRGDSVADEVEQTVQELKLLRAIEANTSDMARRLARLGLRQDVVQPTPAGARQNIRPMPDAANDAAPGRSGPASAGAGSAEPGQRGAARRGAADRAAEPGQRNAANTTARTGALSAADVTPVPDQHSPAVRAAEPGQRATADRTAEPGQRAAPTADTAADARRQPATRDQSGRFTSGESSADSTSTAKSIGHSITEAARDLGTKLNADVSNVDPAIQAAQELGGIMSPVVSVLKPLGGLFGGLFSRNKEAQQVKQHRENVTWLRRIWRTQADANRTGGGRGGMGMMLTVLSSLMAPLLALGRMLGGMRALAGIAGLARGLTGLGGRGGRGAAGRRGAAGAGGSVDGRQGRRISTTDAGRARTGPGAAPGQADTRRAGRASRTAGPAPADAAGPARAGAGGMVKGALRKLPVIGALFGGAMLAKDLMADDDPNLSAEENKKNRYANVGSSVGALAGGAIGMLGGPAGAIAGGLIGDKVGEMVGEWLAGVDLTGIPDMLTKSFIELKDGALSLAAGAFDAVKDGWKGVVDAGAKVFSGMTDWVKDKWDKATETVLDARDTVADKVHSASDYVADKATSVKDAGQNLLAKATGGRYTGGSNARKDELIKAMDAGGITDPQSKAALMANVDHESGGFTKSEENLNYSAKRLQEVFPNYYKDAESARADAGNPEAIANKVYGGRMGNTEAGDGFKYRGRGALQLTGKAQYEEMGKKLGIDLVNNPDLAADPKYSAQIAVQHWKSSGADKAAQAGDFKLARKKTNGGYNGLDDVNSKMEGYLAQAKAGDLTPTRRADEGKVAAPSGVNKAVSETMASVGVRPAAATPAAVASAPSVTPIGVMAPTASPAKVAATATAVPPLLAAPKLAGYAAPAADASKTKIPAVTEVKTLAPGSAAPPAPAAAPEPPLSQNVADRGIAHASAGGLGMFPM